jgi:acetolactate synthase small subunit
MKFNLDLIIANSEGALERVLGKLRQRNFALCSMTAGCTADNGSIKARITVESDRPIEQMLKQLGKLYDVRHIAITASEANVSHVFTNTEAREELELCASL